MQALVHRSIVAVCWDCGDTLVDEGSETFDAAGVVVDSALIPGAAEAVRSLKAAGYPQALVADGRAASFRNILRQHGLDDLFDAEAISEEVGVVKPDARMFRRALDRLGVAPADYARVVMVGNNLARDIKGANALGMISVWLDWAPRRSKTPADPSEIPSHRITRPDEVIALIARLEDAGAR
jgi:putative hydrolase of the HAD superfamily